MTMDLGGNAPVIVMADSDLDKAIAATVSGAFGHRGKTVLGRNVFLLNAAYSINFRRILLLKHKR